MQYLYIVAAGIMLCWGFISGEPLVFIGAGLALVASSIAYKAKLDKHSRQILEEK